MEIVFAGCEDDERERLRELFSDDQEWNGDNVLDTLDRVTPEQHHYAKQVFRELEAIAPEYPGLIDNSWHATRIANKLRSHADSMES
jgi:hypothetical protein